MHGNNPSTTHSDLGWDQLNLTKFVIASLFPSALLRTITYPFSVVKTRLQIQEKHVYNGSIDAFKKIIKQEGPTALYRGCLFTLSGNIPPQMVYIGTLEFVRARFPRDILPSSWPTEVYTYAIAGGLASVLSLTMGVPVDVVTQRLMVQDHRIHHAQYKKYSGGINALTSILRKEGIRGIFRGYGATFLTVAPSSAIWWGSYANVKANIIKFFPLEAPRTKQTSFFDVNKKELVINGISGISSGLITALITSPLDVAKTRLQVLQDKADMPAHQRQHHHKNAFTVISHLWREEGITSLYRGVTLRMTSMSITSFFMITGYNHMKYWSINDTL